MGTRDIDSFRYNRVTNEGTLRLSKPRIFYKNEEAKSTLNKIGGISLKI
jgi:hypothetical protein